MTAAADRVSGLARRLRELGDQRTIAQLTSDIALDLLLYGRTGVGVGAPEPPYDGSAADLAFAAGDGSGGLLAGAFAGDPPPASVQVVVPLSALVGATDEPGEIDGWGCLPGPVLRDLALRAGSVWARLVTDPLSGQAVAMSTLSYRPTPAMRRQVRARDHVCRAPGCSRPARTCELDHDIPHAAGGPTALSNLTAKDSRHHGHKTTGVWRARRDPDSGAIDWTVQTGRTYRTFPHRYDDPDAPPCSRAEVALHGLLLAATAPSGDDAASDALTWEEAVAVERFHPVPRLPRGTRVEVEETTRWHGRYGGRGRAPGPAPF